MNWISIKQGMPISDITVIVTDGSLVRAGIYVENNKEWWTWTGSCETDSDTFDVTHWMPLPHKPRMDD